MTNRERLISLLESDYDDEAVAEIISDELMSITDEDDISIAVICGNDRKLLAEWLGQEVEE